jgi:hypothetical protein
MSEAEKNDKLNELIQLLLGATEKETLHWERTPDEDEFRATLGTGYVRLVRGSQLPFGSPPLTELEKDRYFLSLVSQNGQVIDSFAPPADDERNGLGLLFSMVRRRVLNLDNHYEALLRELKTKAGGFTGTKGG